MVAVRTGLQDAVTTDEFEQILRSAPSIAVHFWAPWCLPCKQMDVVYAELANQYPGVAFVRVEAEELSDISERYNVTMVPHFVLLQNAKKVAEVEGADAVALTAMITQQLRHFHAAPAPAPANVSASASAATAASLPVPAPASAPAAGSSDTQSRIKALLASAPVLLCMKGSPDAPRCGFSAKVVAALRAADIPFSSFDILTDEAIRQGLKEYSNWPTYPQLYANAELLGGCDIVLEMAQSKELKQAVHEALGNTAGPSPRADAALLPQQNAASALESRLKQLTTSHSVMLFMKGSPDAPRCGFSSKVVGALRKTGMPFGTFDILEDEAVRQGLKKFSDWPTYPQLYAGGELVGGCDLVLELDQEGQLKQTLQEAIED